VCNQFMWCEPLRGWRHVRVTARRTRQDWAECIRELADVSYTYCISRVTSAVVSSCGHDSGHIEQRVAQ